jgi:hypothetical protein
MKAKSFVAGALLALFALPALAQAPAGPVNVRGKVDALDGQTLKINARGRTKVNVNLTPDFVVLAVSKVKLDDIKQGDFVGVAALPGKDGKLHAQEVLVFPEAARGAGEGHYPWDLKGEGDTMTNGTVSEVAAVSKRGKGRVLSLKYKDGQQDIIVGARTPVVTFAPDSRDLLKPGATVFVRAPKAADGTITAARVVAEKNGVKPPM